MTSYDISVAVVSDLEYDAQVRKDTRPPVRAGYQAKVIDYKRLVAKPRRLA